MTTFQRPAGAPSPWRTSRFDDTLRGAPYYPEHVDPSQWARDAELMRDADVNVVRMGEFAWHLWEPREGVFDADLFDRAIDIVAAHGIQTILCTPTATPPRWLTRDYPEVLRTDGNGRPAGHGSRQQADTTSPVFRAHSRRITAALAKYYSGHPHVIGWQTDNELNTTASESHSPSAQLAFRRWLAHRYDGDVARLNKAWGGHFWALAYDRFEDVETPRHAAPGYVGPGHLQDYHRFLADATAAFQRDQVEILRAANPDWFVFHNLGRQADIDFRGDFGRDLDVLGFDIYPMLHEEFRRDGDHVAGQAWDLDQARGHGGNFIVPEQASGLGSQPGFSTMTPEPGEMRRMAWSSVAHGADGMMFFRWQPAHFGAEIYWMGLIDHDGRPRRRYAEAKQYFGELKRLTPDLLGTRVAMDVAIAGSDFDNQQAHEGYDMGLPSPQDDGRQLHRACHDRAIACGFVHPTDDLAPLRALYVPHWVMWREAWTPSVAAWVKAGGTLVLSALTGTRTADNHVHPALPPHGGLDALAGVRVTEFGRLTGPGAPGLFSPGGRSLRSTAAEPERAVASSAHRAYAFAYAGATYRAPHLYEALDIETDVEVVATWTDCWLEDTPAITRRSVGRGAVCYVATYLDAPIAGAIVDGLLSEAGIAPLVEAPAPGLDIAVRRDDRHELLFLCNGSAAPARIGGVPPGHDLLADTAHSGGPMTLEPHGCAVLKSARAKGR